MAGAVDFDLGHLRSRPNGLRDLYAGRMTWREVRDFLLNLPQDCATNRCLFGPAARWSQETHLLADIAEILGAAYSDNKAKPYPRPAALSISDELDDDSDDDN